MRHGTQNLSGNLVSSDRDAKRAEAFSEDQDVSEFLASALGGDRFRSHPGNVCFHDPCHLRHGQNCFSAKNFLRRIPGLILSDIPDEGQCCGSAGIYNITHRERSMGILEAKMEAIDKTAAMRVITSNPGCFMQLQYGRTRWNKAWSLSHISQVSSALVGAQGSLEQGFESVPLSGTAHNIGRIHHVSFLALTERHTIAGFRVRGEVIPRNRLVLQAKTI